MRLHVSYEFPFFTRTRIRNARKQNGYPEFACVYFFRTNISYTCACAVWRMIRTCACRNEHRIAIFLCFSFV